MASGLRLFTVPPCRLIDTRGPDGPALAAGIDRTFTIVERCLVPDTAQAISFNAAVTQPSAAGNCRLYPGGTPLPVVSSLNYSAGQTRSNNGIIGLGAAGDLTIRCNQSDGTTHFVLDVNGYLQ